MNLGVATAIAAEGFKNKKDKAGVPYIMHCIRVMLNLNSDDDELNSMAILHDTVEDEVCTIEDLLKAGFSLRVISAVQALTHDELVSYDDYIKIISHNIDAVKVKIADLKDNSDITRLKGLTKKDLDRMEKYHRAYMYLSSI